MTYLVDFENVTSAGISGIQRLTKDDKVYIFYTVNASNLSFAAHLNLLSSPAEIIYYNVASGGKNALDFQLSSFLGYLISKGEEKNFCIISNDRGYEYVRGFWERNGLAAGVSVYSAPSINRSLVSAEKPFAARIQQGQKEQPPSGQEKLVYDIPDTEENTMPEINAPEDDMADSENIPETPAPKRRGRPKGKKTSVKDTAAQNDDAAASALKNAMEKGNISADQKQTGEIAELLRRSAGRQHFYRGLLSIFGMEKGVEVYKILRPEYTNLTKLFGQ